jgi:hypothetical protein
MADDTPDDRPAKRRRGPAPMPKTELRLHSVSCRLTDAEIETLDQRRGHVSRGEWLRRAALSKAPRIVPEINVDAWADLARTSANLNQLTRAINEGRISDVAFGTLKAGLQDLWKRVEDLRKIMIGADHEGEG